MRRSFPVATSKAQQAGAGTGRRRGKGSGESGGFVAVTRQVFENCAKFSRNSCYLSERRRNSGQCVLAPTEYKYVLPCGAKAHPHWALELDTHHSPGPYCLLEYRDPVAHRLVGALQPGPPIHRMILEEPVTRRNGALISEHPALG